MASRRQRLLVCAVLTCGMWLGLQSDQAANAETVAFTGPSNQGGAGMIVVLGDSRENRLRIYESSLFLARQESLRYGWFASAAPAIRDFGEEVVDAIAGDPAAWSGRLAARLTGVFAFVAVLLDPARTEELKPVHWIIIEERSSDPNTRIGGLPPCRPVRWKNHDAVKAVECPTLARYAGDLPQDLYVNGGDGNDRIALELRDQPPFLLNRIVEGDDGADRIVGSEQGDLLSGGDGTDFIYGLRGNDEIWGHDARENNLSEDVDYDTLYGDQGNDMILGQQGDDLIDGGPDSDSRNPYAELGPLAAGLGLSVGSTASLQGGPGNDVVVGGGGSDTMAGNEDDDTLLSNERDLGGSVEEYDPIVDCQGSWTQPAAGRIGLYRRSNTATVKDALYNCTREVPRPIQWNPDLIGWDRVRGFPWASW